MAEGRAARLPFTCLILDSPSVRCAVGPPHFQGSRNHRYREPARNVTFSLDDETALRARIEAACQDMSVSRFVGQVLRERMTNSEEFEQARQSYLNRGPAPLGSGDGSLPGRDEIHQR